MSITYQQAKRIRKTGIMSLFADQLMYEKKVTTAIKKTISLKTRGTIKGITQYMDPLNIAKVMTFGSSLGPALLGHWMGRDPRDIQYFTGRFKPIREKTTGEKLTKLGTGVGTGNVVGVSEVLRKMYKLLASTHEENVRRLELNKNREEEFLLEEQRRHEELLDALGGRGKRKKSKIAAFGDFLSSLWKKLAPLIALMVAKAVSLAFKAFGWLKDLLKWMKTSSVFTDFFKKHGSKLAKFGIAFELITHSGEVGAGSDKVPNADPRAEENKLEPFSMVSRGDAKNVYEAFQKIREARKNKPAPRSEIIQATNGALTEPELMDIYGSTRAELFNWLKINKDPNATFDINSAKTKKVTPVPQTTESVTKPESVSTAPPAVPASATSNKLEEVQNEHTLSRITKSVSVRQPKTVNNTTTTNTGDTIPLNRPIPSVRLQEPEFQNRIYSNTVPVN